MSDKCPYCGAGDVEKCLKSLGLLRDSTGSILEEHIVRKQDCYERQISNLTASRDRWRELAMAQKIIIAYEHRDADYGINAMIQAYTDRDNAIAALKASGEWEE